jgi:uncharacterized BrkB/YihY/UPF0761 family membrane protein
MAGSLASQGNHNNSIAALYLKLHEYHSAIATFAVLNGGALIFLWISRGTRFHQLAIGTIMAAIVLTLALAVFELCWQVGLRLVAPPGSHKN